MNPFLSQLHREHLQAVTRRQFFGRCAVGIGSAALASLLNEPLMAAPGKGASLLTENPLAPKRPHFAPKAKRAIYLHMAGSPSQLDMFDYKPKLVEMNGKDCPTAQFARSIGRESEYYGNDLATAKKIINPDENYPFVEAEIYAATKPHTYGALADRIAARVHDEPGGVFNPA